MLSGIILGDSCQPRLADMCKYKLQRSVRPKEFSNRSEVRSILYVKNKEAILVFEIWIHVGRFWVQAVVCTFPWRGDKTHVVDASRRCAELAREYRVESIASPHPVALGKQIARFSQHDSEILTFQWEDLDGTLVNPSCFQGCK